MLMNEIFDRKLLNLCATLKRVEIDIDKSKYFKNARENVKKV